MREIKYFVFSAICAFLLTFGCKKGVPEDNIDQQKSKIRKVEVLNPWVRPAKTGMNSALYFKVLNRTLKDDTLYFVDSDLAELVQIHETYQKGADLMGMRQVDNVLVPADDSILFKPRSNHVMLIGLIHDLAIGDTGEAVLYFKNAGKLKIKAVVSDQPPNL